MDVSEEAVKGIKVVLACCDSHGRLVTPKSNRNKHGTMCGRVGTSDGVLPQVVSSEFRTGCSTPK